MPISNGFDTTQVMAKLFGRIKWRSLNPAGSVYPLAYSITGTRTDLFLTAGVSAGIVAGGTSYSNSSLIGWTYDVERRGFGTMELGVDYQQDSVNGGFSLLKPGDQWASNEKLIVHFQAKTSVTPPNSTARWYEQFHPMCTLANLRDVAPQEFVSTDTDFNNFLIDLEQGVIMALLNGVFNEPQLIESTLIWDRQLRNDLPYTNMGKFVGYRLFVAPGEFALQISRISFMFNGDANFNLYLFQDMKKDPLYTIPVSVIANDETYVDLPEWILNYTGPLAQGGTFYLGYFQHDLGSVQALEQFVTRWNRSLAFGYTAFEAVQKPQYDFNRIQVPYTYRTYGMNLEVQTYKDFTNRVIKNASLFDEAIGLAMAIIVLGYEAYSVRSNSTERITKEMAALIYGEINNSGEAKELNPYIAGLKKQLQRELYRINKNFFNCDGIVTTRPFEGSGSSLQGVFP